MAWFWFLILFYIPTLYGFNFNYRRKVYKKFNNSYRDHSWFYNTPLPRFWRQWPQWLADCRFFNWYKLFTIDASYSIFFAWWEVSHISVFVRNASSWHLRVGRGRLSLMTLSNSEKLSNIEFMYCSFLLLYQPNHRWKKIIYQLRWLAWLI